MPSMSRQLAPTFFPPILTLRFSYITCLYIYVHWVSHCADISLSTHLYPSAKQSIPKFSHLPLMDSNSSGFFWNPSTLHSVYYPGKEDNGDGIIDLGLSLGTLQPEAYHPSGHMPSLGGYNDLIGWPQPQANSSPQLKNPITGYQKLFEDDHCDEEAEAVQSKERWAYVKVNMDGVMVGRKVCVLDYGGYPTLAHQLEDMFGRQSASGLRLFQAGSEFSLFYKDREDNWRAVGDVPWKEFVEKVRRLRIAKRSEALHSCSSSFN